MISSKHQLSPANDEETGRTSHTVRRHKGRLPLEAARGCCPTTAAQQGWPEPLTCGRSGMRLFWLWLDLISILLYSSKLSAIVAVPMMSTCVLTCLENVLVLLLTTAHMSVVPHNCCDLFDAACVDPCQALTGHMLTQGSHDHFPLLNNTCVLGTQQTHQVFIVSRCCYHACPFLSRETKAQFAQELHWPHVQQQNSIAFTRLAFSSCCCSIWRFSSTMRWNS